MNKLLSANLMRLRKNKLLWLCTASIFCISVFSMLGADTHLPAEALQANFVMKEKYFSVLPLLGMSFAIFASLYLGTDYSDGTMRNKLIVGHSKATVYLSNFVIVFIAAIPMICAWLISGIMGIPAFQMGTIGWQEFLYYMGMYSVSAMALISIFTFTATVIPKRAEAAVVSILLYICMLIGTSFIAQMLGEPELISDLYIGESGGQMIPNPHYVGGNTRTILEIIMDLLPTGQVIQIMYLNPVNPVRMMVLSLCTTMATTAGGIFLFAKKDIK